MCSGSRFGAARRYRCVVAALVLVSVTRADVFTPVASYEPTETDLSVTSNPGDLGLSIQIVVGGSGGAPAATDGTHLLKITITNEADHKIELRHNWTVPAYDLAGNVELLADVYVGAVGALPGLIGIWSPNWQPPDAWQQATGIPATTGSWKTIQFNLSGRVQTNLDYIHAFVFENLSGTSGTIYLDNLRLRSTGTLAPPAVVAANGLPTYNELFWRPVTVGGFEGYDVYRGTTQGGPFTKLNGAPVTTDSYRDPVPTARPTYYYVVQTVADGIASGNSTPVAATYNGLTDEQLLDLVQYDAFQYFWNGAHPHCGLGREGLNFGHPLDTVTTGGSGFGLMSIVVAAERGFVSRADAAVRLRRILRWLDGDDPDNPALPSNVQRYHGAWAHHYNGATGATIAFAGPADNGGDLVETAFLVAGMLTVRQYFDDPVDPVEIEIRDRVTSMWESVEWSWYRQLPSNNFLYWHWSPNFGWVMNLPIRGFNETMIIYLLAIASPTYPMPALSFHQGWAGNADFVNGNFYYGYQQFVGEPLGGPLFFTHYSHLGFDPRYKRDAYTNYFENSRNITLINRAHCIDNPGGYDGYSPLIWGLTASNNPWGYLAHSPTVDNGTVTPTAAISAMPYAPAESLAALRQLYDLYGLYIYAEYGFYDAFNLGEVWIGDGYLAIDQGTIAPMIENYRTGLIWKLFMSNPEIAPMLTAIGMFYEVDYDEDGDIDGTDLVSFMTCAGGPAVLTPPPGCTQEEFELSDLDNDGDADLQDLKIMQRLAVP